MNLPDANSELPSCASSDGLDKVSIISQSPKLVPLQPSVPLSPSEIESLRAEMKQASEWAKKELNSQKLKSLSPSVPLTPSEIESLRKEMSEAMDWAEKELAKG